MKYKMVEAKQNADGTEQSRIVDFFDIQKRLNDFLLNKASRLTFRWEWTEADALCPRHRQFHLILLKEEAFKYKKYVAFLLDEERQSVRFLVWDTGRFLKINSGQGKNLFRRESFMGESLPNYLIHKNFDRLMAFFKLFEQAFPEVRSQDFERSVLLVPGNQLARPVSYRQLKEEAFDRQAENGESPAQKPGEGEETITIRLLTDERELPADLAERRRKIRAVVAAMKERTGQDCLTLSLCKERKPKLVESKVGGLPYWDLAKPYPVDAEGRPLMLLAQIHFGQAEEGTIPEPLPKQGMLQFFIRPDDIYGASFEAPAAQDGFRVVYHAQVDEAVTEEQIRALNIPVSTEGEASEYSPVLGCYALRLHRGQSYLWNYDERFEKLFLELAEEQGLEFPEGESLYRSLAQEEYQYVCNELNPTGHHMLGWPHFTQYDPRGEGSPYDTLLLQVDTEMDGLTDYILWGDCGVGSFFISRDALAGRRFDDVLYSWDCC